MVEAHRAAGDAVEHGALRLRAERILDDGVEHVREAADVGREVVPAVVPVPVLGQVLRRVVDAVGDLDRRRTGRPASAGPRSRRAAWSLVSGADTVIPVPAAPAVPTVVTVAVSRWRRVSTVIAWPAVKPAVAATLTLVAVATEAAAEVVTRLAPRMSVRNCQLGSVSIAGADEDGAAAARGSTARTRPSGPG